MTEYILLRDGHSLTPGNIDKFHQTTLDDIVKQIKARHLYNSKLYQLVAETNMPTPDVEIK